MIFQIKPLGAQQHCLKNEPNLNGLQFNFNVELPRAKMSSEFECVDVWGLKVVKMTTHNHDQYQQSTKLFWTPEAINLGTPLNLRCYFAHRHRVPHTETPSLEVCAPPIEELPTMSKMVCTFMRI